MNLDRHNLQLSDLIETVRRINPTPPTTGYIKAVYTRQSGSDWRLFLGRCVVTSESQAESAETYRECAFATKRISSFSLEKLLATIAGEGYSVAAGLPPIKMSAANPTWKEEIIPSHVTNTFAVKRFSTRVSQDAFFWETPLIAFGMPFQPSAQRRLREFIGLGDFHGANDARKGELSIEIEDRRGRIRLEGNRLSISEPVEDLCIVGQVNDNKCILLKGDESVNLNDEEIRNIDLWMLTKQNEIVDYWSSTEWQHRYQTRGDEPTYEDILKDAIQKGENESCEFKPYIDLKDPRNPKLPELERTVCAFSNLNGGRLLIGVDNDGEVLGLTSGLLKDYGGGVDLARATYQRAIQSRLREALRDNQCFSIQPVELYGKLVLVIAVQKAQDLNFLLDSKQAYIRRGGTSARLTPPEIQLLPQRSSPVNPFGQ